LIGFFDLTKPLNLSLSINIPLFWPDIKCMDKLLTFLGEKIIPIFHAPKLLRKISSLEMELAEMELANARLQRNITGLEMENTSLKAEIAAQKERLEGENTIYRMIGDPYTDYARAKNRRAETRDEKEGKENEMAETLAAFLRTVLEIGRNFYAVSECKKERDYLRMFADELQVILGKPESVDKPNFYP